MSKQKDREALGLPSVEELADMYSKAIAAGDHSRTEMVMLTARKIAQLHGALAEARNLAAFTDQL
jgi:hypothetical protein